MSFISLVVIGIVSVLAALLLPVLKQAQIKAVRIACTSNLRQLGMAWYNYSLDNSGELVCNSPLLPTGEPNPADWFPGCATWPHDSTLGPAPQYSCTNIWCAHNSKLYPYHRSLEVARCPADKRTYEGQRIVRSFSMNCWLNGSSAGDPSGRHVTSHDSPGGDADLTYLFFRRESQIKQPARLWVMVDEDESTLNDSMFLMDMKSTGGWLDLPARRHADAYGVNFADGHADTYRLKPLRPGAGTLAQSSKSSGPDIDWLALKTVTTVQK